MTNNKKKAKIPSSLKHAVWLQYNNKMFECKCQVKWCPNIVTPFTFEAGHNVPESKGGGTSIDNLRPICAACNKSMGNKYTIDEFIRAFEPKSSTKRKGIFCCFQP